jgi:hypothetical protein
LSPIIAVTVCHQRNDVERYSRSKVMEKTAYQQRPVEGISGQA